MMFQLSLSNVRKIIILSFQNVYIKNLLKNIHVILCEIIILCFIVDYDDVDDIVTTVVAITLACVDYDKQI